MQLENRELVQYGITQRINNMMVLKIESLSSEY